MAANSCQPYDIEGVRESIQGQADLNILVPAG